MHQQHSRQRCHSHQGQGHGRDHEDDEDEDEDYEGPAWSAQTQESVLRNLRAGASGWVLLEMSALLVWLLSLMKN